MKKKPIVVYLLSNYDEESNIFNFIKNYKKYRPGIIHDLIICYKNSYSEILDKKVRKKLNPYKYKKIIDIKTNDYDWGSYKRIASKNINKILFFFNCHSYPIKNNWLIFFLKHCKSKTVLAPTGSYQSLSSSSFNGFYFSKIIHRLYYGFANLRYFSLFPNPHLRSNCFMIKSNDFLKLKLIDCKHKLDTWCNESGRLGFSNQLLKKKFNLFVINDEGKKFEINNWKKSNTYAFKNQTNLLISDKHTREYSSLVGKMKKKYTRNIWGI